VVGGAVVAAVAVVVGGVVVVGTLVVVDDTVVLGTTVVVGSVVVAGTAVELGGSAVVAGTLVVDGAAAEASTQSWLELPNRYYRYRLTPRQPASWLLRVSSSLESVTPPLRGVGVRYEPLGVDTRRRFAYQFPTSPAGGHTNNRTWQLSGPSCCTRGNGCREASRTRNRSSLSSELSCRTSDSGG